jgi:hypothetical protein
MVSLWEWEEHTETYSFYLAHVYKKVLLAFGVSLSVVVDGDAEGLGSQHISMQLVSDILVDVVY